MWLKGNFRYIICGAIVIAGVILILCGMNVYRASYLILFGILLLFFKPAGFRHKETPKGFKFWAKTVLDYTLDLLTCLSLANFLLSNSIDGITGIITYVVACLICSILFGSIDYFAHTTDLSEAEYEQRKRQRKELEELYDLTTRE